MAPWPIRQGSHSHSHAESSRNQPPSVHITPPSRLEQLNDPAIWNDPGGDSSSSDSEIHPSRPRRPRHSRSLTHPFPLLFSANKKKKTDQKREADARKVDDFDSSDDDADMNGKQSGKPQKSGSGDVAGGSSNASGRADFATGNCMTCGSLVRWPKELRVFKCTICLTINDLQPLESGAREEASSRRLRAGGHSPDAPHKTFTSPGPRTSALRPNSTSHVPAPRPISAEHTRALIRQCLVDFLTKTLRSQRDQAVDALSPSVEDALAFATKKYWTGPPDLDREGDGHHDGGRTSLYVPQYHFDVPPTLRPNPSRNVNASRSYSSSYAERPMFHSRQASVPERTMNENEASMIDRDPKMIFKKLENYIVASFSSLQNLNSSFVTERSSVVRRRDSERPKSQPRVPRKEITQNPTNTLCDLDPKLLLLGDFAENGSWWTGGQDEGRGRRPSLQPADDDVLFVTTKSPHIDWTELEDWYHAIINAAETWSSIYQALLLEVAHDSTADIDFSELEAQLLQAQDHVQRTLLKATESLLKRPGKPLSEPDDLRFLLMILENPLLHSRPQFFKGQMQPESNLNTGKPTMVGNSVPTSGPISGQHSGIIKRILGLFSNSTTKCHTYLTSWLARSSWTRFVRMKEITAEYLSYRLIRQNEKKHEMRIDVTEGLIPKLSNGRSVAALHAAMGTSNRPKKPKETARKVVYSEDWQIKAASRVLALIFAANNIRRLSIRETASPNDESAVAGARETSHWQPRALPTSDFYNSMLDYADLVADFETWEAKRGRFSFCQYPFLLSIWAKTQILEHDARRQMESKARDAFFDSIMTRKTVNQFLVLDVRRDCLVEDSLQAVSEVIGSGSEDVKKGLRINFRGEEGVDAGGLRKEWFLLLVREVFNPHHGMFTYDEDSQYCYFNPNSFETSDQFFLVGVVMGLAIYNSTILDVALPPFTFRKLLATAPLMAAAANGSAVHARPTMSYSLDDLAEYRPQLARGLKQLLEYDGDVAEAFALDFVVDVDKYGSTVQVPLCQGGERKAVTNANRREYVDLYVRYLLETAVSRQFDPFKRGFFTVCGGNAFSLFRPEEIELLVRGSDEALDVASLRAVAEYEGWGPPRPDDDGMREPTIDWFWTSFGEASARDQRKLLSFITGSDRIPAMGATQLHIKLTCLGEDEGRYPIARTCFNVLALHRYESRERLEKMLWTAVHESEGFGLK